MGGGVGDGDPKDLVLVAAIQDTPLLESHVRRVSPLVSAADRLDGRPRRAGLPAAGRNTGGKATRTSLSA